MTDDLDDLKAMMDAATPRLDAARRAENLALAQKNFDDLQGSRAAPRPTSGTEARGLWTGVKTMLNAMTSKAALTTTTAIVACGLLVLTPAGQNLLRGPLGSTTGITEQQATTVEADSALGGVTVADDAATTDAKGEQDAAPTRLEEALPPTAPAPLEQITDLEITNRSSEEFRWLSDSDGGTGAALDMELPATDEFRLDTGQPPSSFEGDLYEAGDQVATASGVVEPMSQALPVNRTVSSDLTAPQPNTEAFPSEASNTLKITSEDPVSTFSIDVDTSAYSVVRSSLTRGQLPPAQAVRVEEMVNYFPYAYPAPDAGEAPFRTTVSSFRTPWNPNTQLVHIALQGRMPALEDRPPLNLVFLIDTSGSMDDPAKLPLLKQSFRLMLDQLRPTDEVAIVEYVGSAGQVLAPTAATDRTTILQAIQSLGAGGSTNGQGGLEQAYAVAVGMAQDGEVSRVILATDGDFNVGISNPDALKDFIAGKRDTGTYLSVLGFGRGNLDDATMQALAPNGNGTAAYIDTLSEAQKVLVDQLSGALFPIAGDVKVQVEFNPAQVAEYRLIGYETRALAREDFNNDRVDAGELGAGHSVTAIYEITPVGSPAQLSDPLRYQPRTVAETSDELGFVKLRYKEPGEGTSQLIETPIIGASIPGTEANFAAAIAGFGQLLRNPQYLGDWGYEDAIALANANRGEDPFGYRTEAVQLMRLAQSLSR